MSACAAGTVAPSFTAEDLSIRVGTALFFLDLATRTLETAQLGEDELSLDEWELYRYVLTGKIGSTDRP